MQPFVGYAGGAVQQVDGGRAAKTQNTYLNNTFGKYVPRQKKKEKETHLYKCHKGPFNFLDVCLELERLTIKGKHRRCFGLKYIPS
jgi:hypothetical protein